jgi:hypothetical protein
MEEDESSFPDEKSKKSKMPKLEEVKWVEPIERALSLFLSLSLSPSLSLYLSLSLSLFNVSQVVQYASEWRWKRECERDSQ